MQPTITTKFDPIIFLCEQSVITNNYLSTIASNLISIQEQLATLKSSFTDPPHQYRSAASSCPRPTNIQPLPSLPSQTLPDTSTTSVSYQITISQTQLVGYKSKATCPQNFCVLLLRHLFTKEELLNRNFTGTKGSNVLDPVRIDTIFRYYHLMYAENERMSDIECRKAMLSYVRGLKRSQFKTIG